MQVADIDVEYKNNAPLFSFASQVFMEVKRQLQCIMFILGGLKNIYNADSIGINMYSYMQG